MALVYTDKKEFHINLEKGDIGRYVILPGDPGRCKKIAEYLENPKCIAENREYVTYVGELEGVKVSVTSTGMQPEVCGGDLVIASAAVRAEGTTKEYAPIEYPAVAHYSVVRALERAAVKLEAKYHIGVVQCKDNFYGQHSPESMPCRKWLEDREGSDGVVQK